MALTLSELWDAFVAERSIALCPTSLTSDYRQVRKWLHRCPMQDIEQARQVMIWVLGQTPVLTSRRVAMYVKSMYKWAAQEDVAHLARNPLASFKMPKAPQRDIDIIVIPRNEVGLVLAALAAKYTYCSTDWAAYTEFMLQTAMRTGEVRALKWADIKDGKILVHSNWTVGLISHTYRPYDCRHTAISRWIEAGIPVPQVANWAGNTAEVIFKHYCNTTQEYEVPEL
jgi:integrase